MILPMRQRLSAKLQCHNPEDRSLDTDNRQNIEYLKSLQYYNHLTTLRATTLAPFGSRELKIEIVTEPNYIARTFATFYP